MKIKEILNKWEEKSFCMEEKVQITLRMPKESFAILNGFLFAYNDRYEKNEMVSDIISVGLEEIIETLPKEDRIKFDEYLGDILKNKEHELKLKAAEKIINKTIQDIQKETVSGKSYQKLYS